jgi:hypothetical protein
MKIVNVGYLAMLLLVCLSATLAAEPPALPEPPDLPSAANRITTCQCLDGGDCRCPAGQCQCGDAGITEAEAREGGWVWDAKTQYYWRYKTKTAKSAPCSPSCECGCNEGLPCSCADSAVRRGRVQSQSLVAPVMLTPAYSTPAPLGFAPAQYAPQSFAPANCAGGT